MELDFDEVDDIVNNDIRHTKEKNKFIRYALIFVFLIVTGFAGAIGLKIHSKNMIDEEARSIVPIQVGVAASISRNDSYSFDVKTQDGKTYKVMEYIQGIENTMLTIQVRSNGSGLFQQLCGGIPASCSDLTYPPTPSELDVWLLMLINESSEINSAFKH